MKSLRSKTITDAVYQKIKLDILSGVYKPGQRLLENDLAKELDVSRTPIRDATIRLEQEGLITSEPHRGIFVRKLSRKDIQDYYQTRAVLEGLGAKLATINATEEHDQQLREIIEEMRDVLERQKDLDHYKDIVMLNTRFHGFIFQIANNQVLAKMQSTLANPITLIRSTSWINKNRKVEVWEEHRQIVDAIIARDPELAQKKAEEHIYKAWESAAENLEHLEE